MANDKTKIVQPLIYEELEVPFLKRLTKKERKQQEKAMQEIDKNTPEGGSWIASGRKVTYFDKETTEAMQKV